MNKSKSDKILELFMMAWNNVIADLQKLRKGKGKRTLSKTGVQQAMEACTINMVGDCVMIHCQPRDQNAIYGIDGAVLYQMNTITDGGYVDYQYVVGGE